MNTIFQKESYESVKTAAGIIRAGGLVAFPTETVYGLGADALSSEACVKIFEAKMRPFFDPLICHVDSARMAEKISWVSDKAVSLFEKFSPGPLTIVMKKRDIVPGIVTSGFDTVAVRIPANETALSLIRESGRPIAAPSANPFGFLSPTEAIHVADSLSGRIDMIIDGGKCGIGVESTIIRFNEDKTEILRPGGLALEELEDFLHEKISCFSGSSSAAPGMLESHYAPSKKLILIKEGEQLDFSDAVLLSFRGKDASRAENCEILSGRGDIREAAANLFSLLHKIDLLPVKYIYAEEIPETGIGLAVMNRLKKAAADRKFI